MKNICPVCGFDGLEEPAYSAQGSPSYEICPCCGFEFGYDDLSEGISHEAYRENWLAKGTVWFDSKQKPTEWDAQRQIQNIL